MPSTTLSHTVQTDNSFMEAMQIALEANVQLCNMLKTMKQQYGSVSESESDFDYGR
jgi:hypothetical protein